MLADLGMSSRFMGEDEIRRRLRLRQVILVGSDIDRGILGGYVLDRALRVPKALTLYQSSADSALSLSKLVFRRERAGESLISEMATKQASRFLSSHPRLRVIDVSNAQGAVSGSGHVVSCPNAPSTASPPPCCCWPWRSALPLWLCVRQSRFRTWGRGSSRSIGPRILKHPGLYF